MKRLFYAMLFSFCLLTAGCVHAEGTYQDQLDQRIERAVSCSVNQPNYSHGIYAYYKEPIIGRINSEETSNTFILDHAKFVMNLKISSIINQRYYEGVNDSEAVTELEKIAETSGTFADYAGNEHPFSVTLYKLSDSVYIYALSDQVEFFGIGNQLEALQLAEAMIRMARTVRVDSDAVISKYSSRQTIEYTRKRLELFQNIVPENGAIEELFEGYGSYAGQADGEYFGDNYNDDTIESESLDFSQGDEQLDGYDSAQPEGEVYEDETGQIEGESAETAE